MIDTNKKYVNNAGVWVLALLFGGGLGTYFGLYYDLSVLTGLIIGLTTGMAAFGLTRGIKKMVAMLGNTPSKGHTMRKSLRDELQHNIHQASYLKRSGDYQNALNTANLILKIDPDFPEALLLKAQILWEGFQNEKAASAIVGQVLMMTRKADAIHQRALWLATDMDDEIGIAESVR